MEESTGQGGWTILKRKHGDATNFPPAAACILWASVQHERRQAWCCGLEPIFESSGRRALKKAFVGLKPIFESMTGRIVLSHVHVFTLRRTRSTEKLISTGLASGGIITLE